MPRFNEEWKVDPHGPLERLDDGLMTVAAEIRMPLGNFPRRMTVAALSGGRTAIWSAVPLNEPSMAQIEAMGRPAFLIVPGVGHRLDLRPWKARYPDAQVVCAPGAREAVERVVPVDAVGDVLGDPDVILQTVAGVGEREAALLVRRDAGTTLVVNDILANVRHPHGIGAHVMARAFGFGVRHPQMPRVGRRMFVEDEAAIAAAFRAWSKLSDLVRIVVSHGDVITDDPRGVLETMAEDLEPRRRTHASTDHHLPSSRP